MVKAISYTLAAILLCLGLFIFSDIFIEKQLSEFSNALGELLVKVDEREATENDGYSVKMLWESKKEKLQYLVPHNDISYVDYWLVEACGLIKKGEYDLAYGKVKVLVDVAHNLPHAYSIRYENIF